MLLESCLSKGGHISFYLCWVFVGKSLTVGIYGEVRNELQDLCCFSLGFFYTA